MSHPTRRPLGALVTAALLALGAFALGGCANKITSYDPSQRPPVFPAGIPADAKLMLYMDTPNRRLEYADLGLPGVTPEDTLISDQVFYETGPGVVQGTIVDFSNASSFDIFREENGGGYGELTTVPIQPVKKWLLGQAELYRFQDPTPVASRSYIARGEVSGIVNAQSPLSNVSQLSLQQVAGDLQFYSFVASHNGPDGNPVNTSPRDTLTGHFLMQWKPVPNAVAYWLSVVPLTDAYLQGPALLKSGLPRPVFPERFPEYLVAYVTAQDAAARNPDTLTWEIQQRPAFGSQIVDSARYVIGNQYALRIAAIDAQGQVLTYTRDDAQKAAYALQRTNTSYIIFPLGYVIVKAGLPPDAGAGPARLMVARRPLGTDLRPGQTMVTTLAEIRAALKR